MKRECLPTICILNGNLLFPCSACFSNDCSDINFIFFLLQPPQSIQKLQERAATGAAWQQPCLPVSCSRVLVTHRCAGLTVMCNDVLHKPEALLHGQSEHPEPEITVWFGLREGRRFYLHAGSFVKSCPAHADPARALCSRNRWQSTLLPRIE